MLLVMGVVLAGEWVTTPDASDAKLRVPEAVTPLGWQVEAVAKYWDLGVEVSASAVKKYPLLGASRVLPDRAKSTRPSLWRLAKLPYKPAPAVAW